MGGNLRTRHHVHGTRAPDLDLIFRTAPIGLAFLTPDSRYLLINDRMTEICGISVEDHIGRLVREMVPRVADQVERVVHAILRSGEAMFGVELNGQRSDGSNIHRVWATNWRPLKNQSGNIVGINVAAEEITERKRTESELVTSQERLRILNNSLAARVEAHAQERDRIWSLSQDLLVVSDLSGVILTVNPAWSLVLGWPPDDLVGRNGEWLVHPGDRERFFAERDSLVSGHKTLHFENRIMCKDGSYRWVSWFAVTDHGLIYASGKDITQPKQSQQQLRRLRRQLADASRQNRMDTMAASIAHEIRQPLAAIVANANAGVRWLERSEPNLSEAHSAFSRILQAAHQTNEVIAGIRALFGKPSLEMSRLNLRQLVSDVIAIAQGEFDNHEIVVRTCIQDGPSEVMAARVQIQQVMLNLIMNAIEAMRAVTGRDRCLTITSDFDQQVGVTIAIEDTGSGIDPVHLGSIFDAFFTTKSQGMGLGLAISRSIVEAHGGTIRASARIPFGTVFHLTLPISNTPRDDLQLGHDHRFAAEGGAS
jgi:PAS domain S-box-containing protein